MRYDPTTQSFADFLTKYKKLAKQAYAEKTNDIAETFLFAKLPIRRQNYLAVADKCEATIEEVKTFVKRRCQYVQVIPGTFGMQTLNSFCIWFKGCISEVPGFSCAFWHKSETYISRCFVVCQFAVVGPCCCLIGGVGRFLY